MTESVDWDVVFTGLKRLKLRRIRQLMESDEGRARLATFESPLEAVAHLVSEEVAAREATQQEKRLKAARLPYEKTLAGFDFSLQPAVDAEQMHQLASMDFVRHKENVILLGPPGIGKSHLAVALAVEALNAGFKVRFTTAGDLVDRLYASLADGTFKRELKRLVQFDLVLVDELGYLSLDRTASNHFFQVINQAYEHQSVILTSNRPFQEWSGLFDDPVTVTAILDRLLHHAHLFNLKGESYRLREQKQLQSEGVASLS